MGQALGKVNQKDPDPNKEQKLSEIHKDFKGPVENRKCTDVLFVVAIVAMWIIMTGIGIDASENGKPYVLWAPMDSQGFFCGYSQNVTESPYLYFIDTNLRGKCVKECPSKKKIPETADDLICLDGIIIPQDYPVDSLLSEGYCQKIYETVASFKRCIFTNDTLASIYDVSELSDEMEEFAFDIMEAKEYIFGLGFCLSMILGFIFTTLLRVPGILKFLIWASVLLIGVAFLGTAAYMLDTASEWDEADPQTKKDYEINFLRALGWLLIIFLIVYVCLIVFLRCRIIAAMELIKETTRALVDMPLIIIFPVIQLIGLILFMIPWSYYVVYTAGMATVTTTTGDDGYITKSLSYDDELKKRALVYIFIFFWTTEFIIAMGQITLSICFANWYFTRERKRVGCSVVLKALKQGLFYHTGTAAFGSLIIALTKMIRAVLAYIQKKVGTSTDPANKFLQSIFCCLQCCVACFEKCLQFLNKNAYIQTAIFSYNFCVAAKHAVFLILRNIARVGALDILSEILISIGKLFISCFSTFLSYCAITAALGDELHSVVGPTILVFCVSYVTACIFMMVFHMGIDTIFQCFLVDEELFNCAGKTPYASAELVAYMEGYGSKEKKKEMIKVAL